MQRKRFVLGLCALGLGVCATVMACKDAGSSTEGSKKDFRLSLSKREVPVANKVVR